MSAPDLKPWRRRSPQDAAARGEWRGLRPAEPLPSPEALRAALAAEPVRHTGQHLQGCVSCYRYHDARAAQAAFWAAAARGTTTRHRGTAARARRGRGPLAFAPQGFGYHRDSHGVIEAGMGRFPLRLGVFA